MIAIATSTAGVTVRKVVPKTPLTGSVAVIVVEPVATDVASPSLPPALLIVAVAVADELQVTPVVRFAAEASE